MDSDASDLLSFIKFSGLYAGSHEAFRCLGSLHPSLQLNPVSRTATSFDLASLATTDKPIEKARYRWKLLGNGLVRRLASQVSPSLSTAIGEITRSGADICLARQGIDEMKQSLWSGNPMEMLRRMIRMPRELYRWAGKAAGHLFNLAMLDIVPMTTVLKAGQLFMPKATRVLLERNMPKDLILPTSVPSIPRSFSYWMRSLHEDSLGSLNPSPLPPAPRFERSR